MRIFKCYLKHETGTNGTGRVDKSLKDGVLEHANVFEVENMRKNLLDRGKSRGNKVLNKMKKLSQKRGGSDFLLNAICRSSSITNKY